MTVNITVSRSNKPNQVMILAQQNGKQLMKSPMKVKVFTKKNIEKDIRSSIGAYDTPLYGGMNIFFDFVVKE